MTCRGVAYYNQNNSAEFAKSLEVRQPSISDECPEKVFLPVNDGRLIAVNAQTGNACRDFGQNGEINLLASMPYAYLGGYNPTSPQSSPVILLSLVALLLITYQLKSLLV